MNSNYGKIASKLPETMAWGISKTTFPVKFPLKIINKGGPMPAHIAGSPLPLNRQATNLGKGPGTYATTETGFGRITQHPLYIKSAVTGKNPVANSTPGQTAKAVTPAPTTSITPKQPAIPSKSTSVTQSQAISQVQTPTASGAGTTVRLSPEVQSALDQAKKNIEWANRVRAAINYLRQQPASVSSRYWYPNLYEKLIWTGQQMVENPYVGMLMSATPRMLFVGPGVPSTQPGQETSNLGSGRQSTSQQIPQQQIQQQKPEQVSQQASGQVSQQTSGQTPESTPQQQTQQQAFPVDVDWWRKHMGFYRDQDYQIFQQVYSDPILNSRYNFDQRINHLKQLEQDVMNTAKQVEESGGYGMYNYRLKAQRLEATRNMLLNDIERARKEWFVIGKLRNELRRRGVEPDQNTLNKYYTTKRMVDEWNNLKANMDRAYNMLIQSGRDPEEIKNINPEQVEQRFIQRWMDQLMKDPSVTDPEELDRMKQTLEMVTSGRLSDQNLFDYLASQEKQQQGVQA